MITSLTIQELKDYTSRQLNYFFPDNNIVDLNQYKRAVEMALEKIENCYKRVTLKHYYNGEHALFNHLYSDHYVMYLWYLANAVWKETGNKELCNKLYYLNKSLNGLDCMYDTGLPDIFLIFHGVGTMLGKASYNNFFVVLQGCTVGMNRGKYPSIGKGVALTAHTSLIGDCTVGDRVTISSHTNVIDTNIQANTLIFKDQDGVLQQKTTGNSYAQSFF